MLTAQVSVKAAAGRTGFPGNGIVPETFDETRRE
jgi:hypothetical protein